MGEHDADATDFEAAAKQSWQSFSTMRRFVSEAGRLENASWRLWYMQRSRRPARMRKSSSTGSLAVSYATAPTASALSVSAASTGTDAQLPRCVYCELHAAHLSCNGCCHDVYCVACFKLVHKKGHLATHTAVKIQEVRVDDVRSCAIGWLHADTLRLVCVCGGRQLMAAQRSMEQLLETDAEDDDVDATGSSGSVASSSSSTTASQPDVEPNEASLTTPAATKTKPWELQMDLLLQRLMLNSMHTDGDISVHNIDNRDSLGTADSVLSDIPTVAEDKDEDKDGRGVNVPSSTLQLSSTGTTTGPMTISRPRKNSIAELTGDDTFDKPLTASRHQEKRSLSFDGLPPPPYPTTKSTSSSSASPTSPAMTPAVPTLSVPLLLPATSAPLPRAKSKKKNSVCQNCSGNHITIDCPLLASGSGVGGASAAGVMGVDTVLRKCFTTIHNDNLSNSTHAFLGDEISVRGGGHFAKSQWGASAASSSLSTSPLSLSSFGMNSIAEDPSADMEADDDALPVLVSLTRSSSAERKWDGDTWLVSSLATELPQEAYEAVRVTEKACTDPLGHAHGAAQQHARMGWVMVKESGRKWCRRYLSLYRNCLWEFLDDKDTSRPVGFANLSDGLVFEPQHQDTAAAVRGLALQYYRQSSPMATRNECWLQFESEDDAFAWREQLSVAVGLQLDDLFDLAPDAGKAEGENPESYELGKGRFSVVRRACRKQSPADSGSTAQHCALKIIDKNVFWDLVAHETEREDTLVREILTQSVLTVRSASQYCPVIRLLSLFETRSLLVLELELMREGDLHEEIVTNSAIDEVRAASLVASLVKAIAYCLEHGIAHRDVKLSNLALDFATSSKGRRCVSVVLSLRVRSCVRVGFVVGGS